MQTDERPDPAIPGAAPVNAAAAVDDRSTRDEAEALDLLERIGRGDQAAFARFHRTWSRRLRAYVLRHVSDAALADEIVSDTLYDVWRAPGAFRGDAQLATWLIGIARNKALMAWRARRRDVVHDHDDIDDLADDLASDDDDAFDLLARAQRTAGVSRCLEALPDEQRECVQFVFFEDLSLGEVALRQGVPEGTVKTRLFHARRKLEAALRDMLARDGEVVAGKATLANAA